MSLTADGVLVSRKRGECTIAFYDETDTYPLTLAEQAYGISILNRSSASAASFTVTIGGSTLSSVVPANSEFTGSFYNNITALDVSGSSFLIEVRV